MPNGKMKAYVNNHIHCSGYNKEGTIVIDIKNIKNIW